MPKLRVHSFAISLDGYGAGPDQGLGAPLGAGGEALHAWIFPTRTFQQMFGKDGTTGVDNEFAARGFANIGAWIMGRNMFGPVRGEWGNSDWRGWWGAEPPYQAPVFVLTHHPRDAIEMEGGTVFNFVDSFDAALAAATKEAGDRPIDVAGGASAVRQALQAGCLNELVLDIIPVVLGSGERLFDNVSELKAEPIEVATSPLATHIVYGIN